MLDPNQIDQFLARKIAQATQVSPDDVLLGFLDVDAIAQQAVLESLRNLPESVTIQDYLLDYPALTCYGLSVAASIGLVDDDVGSGAIYGAWEKSIGFFPTHNEREPLANQFVAALARMELPVNTISPERELHWMGGCYLFHGAVLPHFVDPLQVALDSVQRNRSLPDPDDQARVTQFANLLAEKVPPGQTRLRKTLRSQVGPLLISRLIRWLLTHDNTLFPAHIQPLLQEQERRGVLVHAPYIQFDANEGQLLLVLPAQTGNVADNGTRWNVLGRQYRAISESPPLPLEQLELADCEFDVKLTCLKDGREDCAYRLAGGICAYRGFRIFDASSGKEKKISESTGHTIDLPVGHSYWIVLAHGSEVQSNHEILESGDFRYVCFSATPGANAISVETAGIVWTMKAKVRPGLYLTNSDEYRFRVTRRTDQTSVFVSYGKTPSLTCVIPCNVETPSILHLSTRLGDQFSKTIDIPLEQCEEPQRLLDMEVSLAQWIAGLPAAVHAITVRLESGRRPMEQQFLHWKGLERITMYGDFRCEQWPANLESWLGFEQKDRVIERPKGYRGKAEFAFSKLGQVESEHWEVPANRVKISLVSSSGGAKEVEEGAKIEFLPDDDRIIQLQTGGLLPIRLICNGRDVGKISNNKPLLSKFLSAIAAEYGRTGSLQAETIFDLPGTNPWPVIDWYTPQTAKECRREESAPTQVIWLVRKVSITGIKSLRIRLIDLCEKLQGDDIFQTLPLEVPVADESTTESTHGVGFTYSVRRKPGNLVHIRLVFDREQSPGLLWVTELECLLSDSQVWQPVMSREKHDRLATIRFLFIGAAPAEGSIEPAIADLFWGDPAAPLAANSQTREFTETQLDQWFATLRWLIGCKYPTPVWQHDGFRFGSVYRRLSAICLFQEKKRNPIWWKHTILDLQRHANQIEPVVIPKLLFTSNLKMAATSFKYCHYSDFPDSGFVDTAFREACVYENSASKDALDYVHEAFGEQRVDLAFLSNFKGWHQLVANNPVVLGDFDYVGWSNKLADCCNKSNYEPATGPICLLSSDHFMECQRKALHRAVVILNIAEQEQVHWLSEPISQLHSCCDRSASAIRSMIGQSLKNNPTDIFLRHLDPERSTLASSFRFVYLRCLTMACCLLALALRAKSREMVTAEGMYSHLYSLVPNQSSHRDRDEKLQQQVALVIGTAPELFSFYFLLFTLTLPKTK